jgi:hypothetical protein
MSLMTNAQAPGWYADPRDSTLEHYWDGTKYHGTRTVDTEAAPPPAPATPAAAQPAPVYVTVPVAVQVPVGAISPKSRTVATILGFFLGSLGVDRFYLGNVGMGVCKLLFGWATLFIWPLIDWIVIISGAAHDGQGLPVTNWD